MRGIIEYIIHIINAHNDFIGYWQNKRITNEKKEDEEKNVAFAESEYENKSEKSDTPLKYYCNKNPFYQLLNNLFSLIYLFR